jgi:hypothetical protein
VVLRDLRANVAWLAALGLKDWLVARELREQLEEQVHEETPAQLVTWVTQASWDRPVNQASVVSRV